MRHKTDKPGVTLFRFTLLLLGGLVYLRIAPVAAFLAIHEEFDYPTGETLPDPSLAPPPSTLAVTRLNNGEPIITEEMFVSIGATTVNSSGITEGGNINGPSCIRVPDWIAPENRADPSAVYYLYFANHRGDYLRLAWAAQIEGPWNLYNVGTGVPVGNRGVLELGSGDQTDIGNSITIRSHMASPDVFVDDSNQRIVMYFHAPNNIGGQKTFVATAPFGLDFTGAIVPVALGRSYFQVFAANGALYAMGNNGDILKALDPVNPWTPPPGFDFTDDLWIRLPSENNPFIQDISDAGLLPIRLRHSAVRVVGDTLQVFYSRKEDEPERILLSTIDLTAGDFDQWDATFPPEEILRPQLEWEGANLPILPSSGGDAVNVHQLRDPEVFEDIDGGLYLFYSGRGEEAIGLALLEEIDPEPPALISRWRFY